MYPSVIWCLKHPHAASSLRHFIQNLERLLLQVLHVILESFIVNKNYL